jgi:hypothetical protein
MSSLFQPGQRTSQVHPSIGGRSTTTNACKTLSPRTTAFPQFHHFSVKPIELELKSRHLAEAHLPGGARQPEVKEKFGHDMSKTYRELPDYQVLTAEEFEVLDKASTIYKTNKGFGYIA